MKTSWNNITTVNRGINQKIYTTTTVLKIVCCHFFCTKDTNKGDLWPAQEGRTLLSQSETIDLYMLYLVYYKNIFDLVSYMCRLFSSSHCNNVVFENKYFSSVILSDTHSNFISKKHILKSFTKSNTFHFLF